MMSVLSFFKDLKEIEMALSDIRGVRTWGLGICKQMITLPSWYRFLEKETGADS